MPRQEVNCGIKEELRNDKDRHYEYEYTIEISDEQHQKVIDKIKNVNKDEKLRWSGGDSCTEFICNILDTAGVDQNFTDVDLNVPMVNVDAKTPTPGQMAKDLHKQGNGKYTKGGKAGRPESKLGTLGNDPHTSPKLTEEDINRAAPVAQDSEYYVDWERHNEIIEEYQKNKK